MATTAEGVETAEQLAIARAEGCTEVQGFYFGQPVSADKTRCSRRTAASPTARAWKGAYGVLPRAAIEAFMCEATAR